MEKNNRVKLYVIWPFLPDADFGPPQLHCAEFEETEKTYRCKKDDYPPGGFRAFGWLQIIPKQLVRNGWKLDYAGFPALTPGAAVARWRRHLKEQLDHSQRNVTRIKAALRGFKTPKELKHGR